jgi:hypothetical protein
MLLCRYKYINLVLLNILNEKVITSESILERFKSQLSDLDINQSASIKNNKDSEDILNQIAQIVDKLNNDIDNHNASGSIPPSSSSENNSFLGLNKITHYRVNFSLKQ